MVSNKEGMRWETAFCETDNVDIRVEKEKVVAIILLKTGKLFVPNIIYSNITILGQRPAKDILFSYMKML